MADRVQHVIDIGAGETLGVAHEFGLALEREPSRILRVGPVDDIAKGFERAGRAVEQADRPRRLDIDVGDLLARAEIGEGSVAAFRGNAVGDAAAGAALVEAEHEPRMLPRAAMVKGVDA